jgi:hypothetical protein
MKRLTVPNDNLLEKVCDGGAEKYVKDIVKRAAGGMYTVLLTSQELIIDYVRVCIMEKIISPKDVEFLYNDKVIIPDENGMLDHWPEGFCDYRDKLLNKMLFEFLGDKND